ncbi:MAG TPA: bifunctional N(6)-L-threonylcarbamoyladenine synthase/serine/threonine protein kinase [Methanocella sp.]|uniref:bifunctional N(6)-L-threonylcarbamoyladenine synthase/serine/threonine protein kinase n=1 Tax=Methanocella sp. TaxID=2052833 RepID=UPI002C8826E9|nr:bifunctional N(6)-L-threonylcarbamoyladenine synthase/serine/threonine protein kinase [Methanocella sp.]HTY92237.1 bifunctional N(6)-L-threonylcarbamoyladenine synthase/serine/threonine protein kinase [Methanocella sp.]
MRCEKVLGIEGTAWSLSAAIVGWDKVYAEAADPYIPETGGIHPMVAAQHHAAHIGEVIKKVVDSGVEFDGVAFSQGPGLGPCLRTVATAARALALACDIPLIGVNHCVAHIEVGRWQTGCRDPVTLYVSGANSQVLAFRAGKYRIFGETLDIGIGNALDKFGRFLGLQHPGGPKIEALAKEGRNYIHLPYVVKGMDLSFSGMMSSAKEAAAVHPREDVCYSLQENAFAMLVEVTERAMAHTGKDECLIAGGVGANMRLQQMLGEMCKARGAKFYAPPRKYFGDNGSMIAYTGLLQLKHGMTLPVEGSAVNPCFRPDEVDIPWL